MKIGIPGYGFVRWGGGIDFLRIICGSIAVAKPEAEFHLLVPTNGPRVAIRKLLRRGWYGLTGRPMSLDKPPSHSHIMEFVRTSQFRIQMHKIDIGNAALVKASNRLGLQVMLPTFQPLRLPLDLPWLGYIPDFQHAYFPQYFLPSEIVGRNKSYRRMLQKAKGVIVNSNAVANDIQRFMPGHRAVIYVLPFAAAPDPAWFDYGVQSFGAHPPYGRYFIISNQFWQHKDHLTAFRAFAYVCREYPDLNLICTGEMSDYRNPAYFPKLIQEANALGITSRLHLLGLVPKSHQIALMRRSLAVIQPTLFEGGPGGGSVFDAVSLGVSAIVSDIAINKEIAEPTVRYFRASDSNALAAAMIERVKAGPESAKAVEELINSGKIRQRACGEVLLKAINEWL